MDPIEGLHNTLDLHRGPPCFTSSFLQPAVLPVRLQQPVTPATSPLSLPLSLLLQRVVAAMLPPQPQPLPLLPSVPATSRVQPHPLTLTLTLYPRRLGPRGGSIPAPTEP